MTLTSDHAPGVTGPDGDRYYPDGDGDGELAGESSAAAVARWFRHAPAERAPVAGIPAVWTAAEILHAAGMSPWFTGAAALVAAASAFGLGERRARIEAERDALIPGSGRARLRGAELAGAVAGAGAWVTAAAKFGPLSGPFDLMTLLYGAGCACGYWWLRTHEAVRAARRRRDGAAAAAAAVEAEAAAWRERCAQWHRLSLLLGIPKGERSHLLEWHETPLGETWRVKTIGTGHRASQLAGRDLAERLAELGGRLDGTGSPLPPGRVEVTRGRVAGELWFTVRDKGDPWARPLWHPMAGGELDPRARFADLFAVMPSARTPVPVGADPETGTPMLLPFFESAGARHVMLCGTTGAGKTMIVDTSKVQFTRAPDVRWFQINLVKPRAERKWVGLAEGSALAGDDGAQARAVAILDYLCGVIEVRSTGDGGDDRLHQPTAEAPHYIGVIDEVAATATIPACAEKIRVIEQTGRENAVSLLVIGQRPVQKDVGGMAVRANTTFYVYGAMIATDRRRGSGSDEVQKAPRVSSVSRG